MATLYISSLHCKYSALLLQNINRNQIIIHDVLKLGIPEYINSVPTLVHENQIYIGYENIVGFFAAIQSQSQPKPTISARGRGTNERSAAQTHDARLNNQSNARLERRMDARSSARHTQSQDLSVQNKGLGRESLNIREHNPSIVKAVPNNDQFGQLLPDNLKKKTSQKSYSQDGDLKASFDKMMKQRGRLNKN